MTDHYCDLVCGWYSFLEIIILSDSFVGIFDWKSWPIIPHMICYLMLEKDNRKIQIDNFQLDWI